MTPGFGQELPHDLAVGGADGLAHADLAGALVHRHGHGVDDREPADEERDDGDAVEDGVEDLGGAGDLVLEGLLGPVALTPATASLMAVASSSGSVPGVG